MHAMGHGHALLVLVTSMVIVQIQAGFDVVVLVHLNFSSILPALPLRSPSLQPVLRRVRRRRDGRGRQAVAAEALDLGVPVHAGVQAHADGAADGLGHLALVDGAQAGVVRVLDAAHGGHELGDEGEVLVLSAFHIPGG